jgi:hypothetical protein
MDSKAQAVVVLGIIGAIIVVCLVIQSLVSKRYQAQMLANMEDARALSAPLPGEQARVSAIVDRQQQRTAQQQWIATSGTAATARIVAAEETQKWSGHDPLLDLTLEVQGPDGPYRVEEQVVVRQLDIPLCQRGSAIVVRLDPGNRNDVVVLFDGRMVAAPVQQ